MSFPKDFVWGAAAASYQIEGAAEDEGKGLSVWDMFCRKPGAIWNGQSGDLACDHYHRMAEDVALMQTIGLQAYRLSISWPRVLPAGTGAVNAKGLEFYDRLIDALLAAQITPYVTLFHWDYPYELYCRGGWLNPASPAWFAEYVQVIVAKLSDRVRHWMTLNEPQVFVGLGHQTGRHAPGDRLGHAQVLRVGHHALLAHGKAVQAIRAYAKTPAQVGYAPVGVTFAPATEQPEDVRATREAMFAMTQKECFNNSWWFEPVLRGTYPADGLALFGQDAPVIRAGEMETICQPLDFLGVNIYAAIKQIRAGRDGQPEVAPLPVGSPLTAFRWNVTPAALYWGPKFFWERYRVPLLITENGMSNVDWIARDGQVHDPQRIDFLHRYLRELQRACAEGVDVRGYFQWSIMDNFEWAEGYRERFGLVYVDYPTQQRIPKDSASWYKDVIASNGANLK